MARSARKSKAAQLGLFDTPVTRVQSPVKPTACACEGDETMWACYAPHPKQSGIRCYRGAGHSGDHMLCGLRHEVHIWKPRKEDKKDRLFASQLKPTR